MTKQISIVMPFLNESNWPYKTVQSIYDTADNGSFEIIAIDDMSKELYDFSRFPDVKYIRNTVRKGVDGCRHMGVEVANTNKILILDAHMLFYPNTNWLNKVIDCIKKEEKCLWCFTCVGIGYGIEDLNHPNNGKYYGADLKLFTEKEKDRPARSIIEPVWASKKPEIEGEVQCILGANYAFSKDYFLYLHGLKNLKSWGSSEPCLSIKAWLSGGSCKINTEVQTAHLFRDNSPYITNISDLVYNKILLLKTIFPKELEDKLMTYIPKDINYDRAMKMINDNSVEIENERKYYQSIFKHSIYDFCKRFNIAIP